MFLAQSQHEVDWQPGVGDPEALAWVIAGFYLVAWAACLLCWVKRRRLIEPDRVCRFGWYWLLLSGIMLVLGINKQWDLQVVVYELARNFAIDQAWFDARRGLIWGFSIVLALVSLAGLVGLFLLVRGQWGRVWLGGLGLAVLVLFGLQRVVSILIVKLPLGRGVIGPVRGNHVFEMAGIALVVAGAVLNLRRGKTAGQSASYAGD